jgi:hypothetical protein
VAVHDQLDRAADHHLRQLGLGCRLRVGFADGLAAAQHHDAVGDAQRFLQLVGDEHDSASGGLQRLDDAEEVLDLLWCQYGGRLVEDDDLRVAEQDLDDLDALLHADGELLGDRVRIEVEPEFLGQVAHLGAGGGDVDAAHRQRRLDAEHDVLGNGEHRHEHEVLVHHADAGPDRVTR